MSSTLKKATGQATSTGSTVFTVPTDSRVTLIGLRCSNTDTEAEHWVEAQIAGSYVTGREVPLPVGSAIDFLIGSKIVAEGGDEITVFSDDDLDIDVYVSFLEQE